MNELNTYGVAIISSELVLKPVGDTFVVNFLARTLEKNKSDKPREAGEYDTLAHFFNFEIWDTAAKFLVEHAKKGDRIIIHSATPREHRWQKEENGAVKNFSKVVFRVNKFQIFPYNKPESQE